jgi:hypothetical protein
MSRRFALLATAATALAATTGANAALVTDPAGIVNLQPGYSYTIVSNSCEPTRSTESGALVPMPEDFDANVLLNGPSGELWLLSGHELTQPRAGDFQGDAGKAACAVPEQHPTDDGDSDGWGSVSRIVLAKDGTTVLRRELITTGLHNLCAANLTPWKTWLVSEEFPFINDPELRSGWHWEIDPATGAATRLTAMGRFSHEQPAYAANGSWYMTDDRGNWRFNYKFVPDSRRDLTSGELYGLAFNRVTMTGAWVGPLNPMDPDSDMRARGFTPEMWGFSKAEGIVASAGSWGTGGNSVTFTESGQGNDPGRVWKLEDLGGDVVTGRVLVEGDWVRLSRPDNLRYNDAGDLFIFEDNSLTELTSHGADELNNQILVLPRNSEGTQNLITFASTPSGEPTGPWFSDDGKHLYVSIQDQPRPGMSSSRVLAIRHPKTFNQPYDR